MSIAAAVVPVRPSTTTYAQLTERAARCIARAHIRVTMDAIEGRRPNAFDVSAHHDLAAALVHLGGTLTRPLASGSTRPAAPPRRAGRPAAALVGGRRPGPRLEPRRSGGGTRGVSGRRCPA